MTLFVHGFFPYFYFPGKLLDVHSGLALTSIVTKSFAEPDLATFETALAAQLDREQTKNSSRGVIKALKIVKRDPLMYYRHDSQEYSTFVKITLDTPTTSNKAAKILTNSESIPS